MNARQKAKRYKQVAEMNKAKAEAFDRLMRANAFRRVNERRVIPLRIAQILPNYGCLPQYAENRAKELIAQKLGEFLIDNKLVYFEISDAVSFTGEDATKITATLTVLEPIERGGVNE